MSIEEKARQAEKVAEETNRYSDWMTAARLWKEAGNNERAAECRLSAAECKN